MRNFLLSALLVLFLCSAGNASLLTISQPKDKIIASQEVIMLTGSGPGLRSITVNNAPIEMDAAGNFSCGLILAPGKNFVEVVGWNSTGQAEKKTLRILRTLSFEDADETYDNHRHWARHEVVTLATLGIIEGYPDGDFYLNQAATRGEFATWVIKAKGIKVYPVSKDVFFDVPKEHWRAPYIKAAYDKHYMKAVSPNNFGIDDPLMRSEATRIAVAAEGGNFTKEINALFYDVPKSSPFYAEIEKSKEKGLIKGVSHKVPLFQPKRDLTRAEATILLFRFSRVKWLEKWLFDFSQGYSARSFCKINTPPKVNSVSIDPQSFSIFDENTSVTVRAEVSNREGMTDILHVRADLTALGGAPDAEMKFNGDDNDARRASGEYLLQLNPTVEAWGEKTVTVTAIDRYGWSAAGRANATVVR